MFNDMNPPATVQRQHLELCSNISLRSVLVFETNSCSPAASSPNRPRPGSLSLPRAAHSYVSSTVTHPLCSEHGITLLELWEDVSWRMEAAVIAGATLVSARPDSLTCPHQSAQRPLGSMF